jgi:hypothetical protein
MAEKSAKAGFPWEVLGVLSVLVLAYIGGYLMLGDYDYMRFPGGARPPCHERTFHPALVFIYGPAGWCESRIRREGVFLRKKSSFEGKMFNPY